MESLLSCSIPDVKVDPRPIQGKALLEKRGLKCTHMLVTVNQGQVNGVRDIDNDLLELVLDVTED